MWCTWGEKEDNKILMGKPEGKSSIGTPRSRWEDAIKMDIKEINGSARSGLIWLRVGTGGGHL